MDKRQREEVAVKAINEIAEAAGLYVSITGKNIGPTIEELERQLSTIQKCSVCKGSGLRQTSVQALSECAYCDGTGKNADADKEAQEAIKEKILAKKEDLKLYDEYHQWAEDREKSSAELENLVKAYSGKIDEYQAKINMLERITEARLKLYVWPKFKCDYADGLAFAVAETVQEAVKLVAEKDGITDPFVDGWGPVEEHPLKKIAFSVWGGG